MAATYQNAENENKQTNKHQVEEKPLPPTTEHGLEPA